MPGNIYDLIVIGGGFYGCEIARYFRKRYNRILIIDRESELLKRASYVNQARVHNGYHYPRNLLTAKSSHNNYKLFLKDYSFAIDKDFLKLYLIAKSNSKVTPNQFERFMHIVGAPTKDVKKEYSKLINTDRIDAVYQVEECAFNAVSLRKFEEKMIKDSSIDLLLNTEAVSVHPLVDNKLLLETQNGTFQAKKIINCTYSRINTFLRNSKLPTLPFKHEIIEMALVKPPDELKNIGLTVMDGPFFSMMPFPAKQLHSLSHVHYTPITSWADDSSRIRVDPYKKLNRYMNDTRVIYMIKDAARYVPAIEKAKYVESLYEIKTVLLENEEDDGRPILFRPNYGIPNFSLVMGGKIDNIYDIINAIEMNTSIW